MTETRKPIPDPDSPDKAAEDTPTVPDLPTDPVEKEKERTRGLDVTRPDLA